MKVSGNVLETLEDLGLLNLNSLKTDEYQALSLYELRSDSSEDSIEICSRDRDIKFFTPEDFSFCFKKTEASLGIHIFKNN